MKKIYKVYVAGPMYSSGNIDDNIRQALEISTTLRRAGFLPFIPHLYFFWNIIHPMPRDYWMSLDLDWLSQCDYMLRLPGYSEGGDIETDYARDHGIPVYANIDTLIKDVFG